MLQNFEEFKVIERLDETHSGSTQIFVGRYEQRLLVCKCIAKKSMTDSKAIEHVLNEKQALKYFTEEGVKGVNRLVHTFQDKQQLYIVLQPVKGLPLHKLLQMAGPFNSAFTFLIAVQVGLILKDIHERGFIYRDIKASNFMIDALGRVTLIDLGHSKRIEDARTFTICGTTHSMPPEIYEGKGYSYQFDHYGFGILIYELLTGRAPFGYSNTNPNLIEDMKKGINQIQLNAINCPNTQDLILRLLNPPETRLGKKGGFDEILEHEYFNVPQFLEAKDIYQQVGQIDPKDPNFSFYVSQIVDFGLEQQKFEEISKQDPFYKFFG